HHFLPGGEIGPDFPCHCRTPLQTASLGQVDDELDFVLVVKGQHFYRHRAGCEQGQGTDQQQDGGSQEEPSLFATLQQRPFKSFIQFIDGRVPNIDGSLGNDDFFLLCPQQNIPQVGGNGQGHKKGHQHGNGCPDGHGGHIGAHHPGNKGHGKHGGNYGEGRQNGGVSDLVDGEQGGILEGQPFHLEMAVHVLRDDDGIIHHDPGDKDQCEEGDPIQGVIQ